jgi:hypothetical protein
MFATIQIRNGDSSGSRVGVFGALRVNEEAAKRKALRLVIQGKGT